MLLKSVRLSMKTEGKALLLPRLYEQFVLQVDVLLAVYQVVFLTVRLVGQWLILFQQQAILNLLTALDRGYLEIVQSR